MQQGELIVRDSGKDEFYWVALLLLTGFLWSRSEGLISDQLRAAAILGLAVAMVAVRFLVLRQWNVQHLSWSMDDTLLVLGNKTVPLSTIHSAGMQPGRLSKHSWTLVIRAEHTIRCASLTHGAQLARSVEGIQALGYAIKTAVERQDKH